MNDVKKPEKDEWGTALEAFEAALALERFNNQSLLELHDLAGENNDSQVCGKFHSQSPATKDSNSSKHFQISSKAPS